MEERIRKIVEELVEKREVAGVSICVIKDGKEYYRNEFGYANLEDKVPIKKDTIFRMYSMTKPVTAVATMMLFERGYIDLLDPVSKYLDGFKNQKVMINGELKPVEKEVTIQDLLNMTSGVVYPNEETEVGMQMKYVFDNAVELALGGRPKSTVELCNEIGRVPLAHEPGKYWGYGASADVLGAVIEVVTGRKYSEFLKDELFIPLGMIDTDFYVPEEKYSRFATTYHYRENEPKLIPYVANNLVILDYKKPPAFESGGAGLASTIDDYGKFASMLLNNGVYENRRYLGRKTAEFLRSNQLSDEQLSTFNWEHLQGYGYGNLMRVMKNKSKAAINGSLGEYGWDGWAGTYVGIDPEENMIILYYMQRVDKDYNDRRKVFAAIYGSLE